MAILLRANAALLSLSPLCVDRYKNADPKPAILVNIILSRMREKEYLVPPPPLPGASGTSYPPFRPATLTDPERYCDEMIRFLIGLRKKNPGVGFLPFVYYSLESYVVTAPLNGDLLIGLRNRSNKPISVGLTIDFEIEGDDVDDVIHHSKMVEGLALLPLETRLFSSDAWVLLVRSVSIRYIINGDMVDGSEVDYCIGFLEATHRQHLLT